jgi:hypothetical protein
MKSNWLVLVFVIAFSAFAVKQIPSPLPLPTKEFVRLKSGSLVERTAFNQAKVQLDSNLKLAKRYGRIPEGFPKALGLLGKADSLDKAFGFGMEEFIEFEKKALEGR